MLQQKISKEFLAKIILAVLALALISIGLAFGLAQYKEKIVFKEDIRSRAEKILELNNIKGYSLKSVKKDEIELPEQFEISKAILVEFFPNFSNHSDGDVWQVKFNGEIKELEYSVIFDPNGKDIIAAFVNDERMQPGVAPLKIKEEKSIIDSRCSQKAKVSDICSAVGVEFDSNKGICVIVNGAGCIDKLPFGSLEECQKTCETSAVPGNELKFETVLRGYYNEYYNKNSEGKNFAITSKSEWEPISGKVGLELSAPITPIDFNKDMLIAVFQGSRSTGGYSAEITKISENEFNLEVHIKEVSPGLNCFATEVFTSPYHIVKIKKSDKEVMFNIEKDVINCQ